VLDPIIERFLADREPGLIPWAELDDVTADRDETADEAVPLPFPVWTRSIGHEEEDI
jgi:hypothetical protein